MKEPTTDRVLLFAGKRQALNRKGEIKPLFRVQEVAKTFFGRSADWMHWLITQHEIHENVLVLDGEELKVKRTPSGARMYSLPDIEKFAIALHNGRWITDEQCLVTMNMLLLVGMNYGVFPIESLRTTPISWTPEAQATPHSGQMVIPGLEDTPEEAAP